MDSKLVYTKVRNNKLIRQGVALDSEDHVVYKKKGHNKLIRSSQVVPTPFHVKEKKTNETNHFPKKKPEPKKKNEHCKYFKLGKCEKGDKCPFLHDKNELPICKFFLHGCCSHESKCPFRHESAVCPKFLKGTCLDKECPFPHVYDEQVCNLMIEQQKHVKRKRTARETEEQSSQKRQKVSSTKQGKINTTTTPTHTNMEQLISTPLPSSLPSSLFPLKNPKYLQASSSSSEYSGGIRRVKKNKTNDDNKNDVVVDDDDDDIFLLKITPSFLSQQNVS